MSLEGTFLLARFGIPDFEGFIQTPVNWKHVRIVEVKTANDSLVASSKISGPEKQSAT